MIKLLIPLLCLIGSAFAAMEGTFIEYQESSDEELRDRYQYPLLHETEGATKDENLSLQQQVADYFGTFVTSSPYPGVRATPEGTELMSNLSNVNKDLAVLHELRDGILYMQKKHIPFPKHPRIFLSGQIEVTGFVIKDATGHARSNIELTDVKLDFLIVPAPWIFGYIGLEYENLVDRSLSLDRILNSRIHGDSIFVTLGDLTCTPWYLTIGQTFVPFGQYTTFDAIHSPLTDILFRTLARDVALGYYNETIHCVAYVFKGSSFADSGNNINNYGIKLGYKFNFKKLHGKLSVGAIRNIADSLGMQAVFGDPINSEKLRHVVPGFNFHGNILIGNWNLILAYNQALRAFSRRDTAFSKNGTTFFGPRPKAFDIELAYSFTIVGRPTSIALAHTRSYQALAFDIPKERTTLTWAIYVFRGSLLSFELNSDKLYDASNRVRGNSVPDRPYFIKSSHLGHRDYSFGIDFLLYF
ncbi:MAG: hypothetical protein K1060chlam2_01531 [Chlamydiae bacterium]|nr:hypothetical protein [Chlamydiota bacterium]